METIGGNDRREKIIKQTFHTTEKRDIISLILKYKQRWGEQWIYD